MAYRNLVNISGLDAAGAWRHVKDFLTSRNGIADYSASGLGWTLHDSSFAVDADTPTVGDWVVLTSPGESGDDAICLYLLYSTVANGILRYRSGLWWDATTHARVQGFPNADQTIGLTSGSSFNLYVYGDLDAVHVLIGNGTYLYGIYCGSLEAPLYDPTIARTTGAVSSGSNVVLPMVSVPSAWRVGDVVVVRDLAGVELATIADIAGANVTVASLAASYASGARVSRDCAIIVSRGNTYLSEGYGLIGRGGAVAGLSNLVSGYNPNTTLTGAVDPDPLNSVWLTDRSHVIRSSAPVGYFGAHRHLLTVSATGITLGTVYQVDPTGDEYRALGVYFSSGVKTVLLREV